MPFRLDFFTPLSQSSSMRYAGGEGLRLRGVVAGLGLVFAGLGVVGSAWADAPKTKIKTRPAAVKSVKKLQQAPQKQPEARLLEVIALVDKGQLDAAIKVAGQLTQDVPNFRVAQLVYADLLRYRTGRFKGPGAIVAQSRPATGTMLVKHSVPGDVIPGLVAADGDLQSHLQGLQQELKRRVHFANDMPAAGTIPNDFLMLGTSVRHAIAIDASKSRLYLLLNEAGNLRVVDSYYVSVGKLGLDKLEEGDQKTPQGIYFVGRQIPGPKLPDFYGKGALTVNYPNDWDRATGRAGSGIWLHGAPPDQFSRVPEASDGCVVLANPDLITLMQTVDLQTPVLIRDKLQWVAQADSAQRKAGESFATVMETWKSARGSADQHKVADLYAKNYVPIESNQALQTRMTAYFNGADVALQDLSVYAWKDGKGEIRVVNLKLTSKAFAEGLKLRQYWQKSGSGWKILSEDVMG